MRSYNNRNGNRNGDEMWRIIRRNWRIAESDLLSFFPTSSPSLFCAHRQLENSGSSFSVCLLAWTRRLVMKKNNGTPFSLVLRPFPLTPLSARLWVRLYNGHSDGFATIYFVPDARFVHFVCSSLSVCLLDWHLFVERAYDETCMKFISRNYCSTRSPGRCRCSHPIRPPSRQITIKINHIHVPLHWFRLPSIVRNHNPSEYAKNIIRSDFSVPATSIVPAFSAWNGWRPTPTHTRHSSTYALTAAGKAFSIPFFHFSHFHLLIFSREMFSILARRAIYVQWNAVHGNDGKNTGRTMDITVDSAVAIHVVIISRLKCTPCVSIEIVSYYA